MKKQDQQYRPALLVYAGEREGVKGTRLVAYCELVNDAVDATEKLYEWKRGRDRVIGGIYKGAEFTVDGQQLRGLDFLQYAGRIEDQERIIGWQVRNDQAVQFRKSKAYEAEAKGSELERILLPLRIAHARHYDRYDTYSAHALEQAVLKALRVRPRKSEV